LQSIKFKLKFLTHLKFDIYRLNFSDTNRAEFPRHTAKRFRIKFKPLKFKKEI